MGLWCVLVMPAASVTSVKAGVDEPLLPGWEPDWARPMRHQAVSVTKSTTNARWVPDSPKHWLRNNINQVFTCLEGFGAANRAPVLSDAIWQRNYSRLSGLTGGNDEGLEVGIQVYCSLFFGLTFARGGVVLPTKHNWQLTGSQFSVFCGAIKVVSSESVA